MCQFNNLLHTATRLLATSRRSSFMGSDKCAAFCGTFTIGHVLSNADAKCAACHGSNPTDSTFAKRQLARICVSIAAKSDTFPGVSVKSPASDHAWKAGQCGDILATSRGSQK